MSTETAELEFRVQRSGDAGARGASAKRLTRGPRPELFITVVHYGNPLVTEHCLRSLKDALPARTRVLVVDFGPGPFREEVGRDLFGEAFALRHEQNLGYAAGCNVGIRHAAEAGADFVLLLTNDVVASPRAIVELLQAAKRHPRAGLFAPLVVFKDRPDLIWSLGALRPFGTRVDAQPLEEGPVDWAVGSVLLVPLWAIREAGALCPDFFMYAEEDEFALRLRARGIPIIGVPTSIFANGEAGQPYLATQLRAYYSGRNKFLLLASIKSRFPLRFLFRHFWDAIVLGSGIHLLQAAESRDWRVVRAFLRGTAAGLRLEKGEGTL